MASLRLGIDLYLLCIVKLYLFRSVHILHIFLIYSLIYSDENMPLEIFNKYLFLILI